MEPGIRNKRFPDARGTHPGNCIMGQGCGCQHGQALLLRRLGIGQADLLAALVPDHPGNHPGIHSRDAHNPIRFHYSAQAPGAAEIGRLRVILPANHSANGGSFGLVVVVCHAVIAHQRVGHNHRLVRIGRVGQNFLISHHGGVEHQLQHLGVPGAETAAINFRTVFQNQFPVKIIFHNHYFSSGSLLLLWIFSSKRSFCPTSGTAVGYPPPKQAVQKPLSRPVSCRTCSRLR